MTVEVSIKQLNNGDSLKAQMVDQLVQKSIEQLSRNCDWMYKCNFAFYESAFSL